MQDIAQHYRTRSQLHEAIRSIISTCTWKRKLIARPVRVYKDLQSKLLGLTSCYLSDQASYHRFREVTCFV